MNIDTPNLPPQAAALLTPSTKVSTYESTGGAITSQFAAHNITLAGPIPPTATIHDNASGAGNITRALLAANQAANTPTTNLTIHATDTDQIFLDALARDAATHAWPVHVHNARSEALPFADNSFTHSFTNMAIFFTSGAGLDGASEIYRTLKPGGTAVANCWAFITWFFPIKKTHDKLRPGKPFPAPPINWADGAQIKKVMLEAGFKEEHVRLEKSEGVVTVGRNELWKWAEKTWAYLGGVGEWQEDDGEKWNDAVDTLCEELLTAVGTTVKDDKVQMMASQWVIVATK